MRETTTLLEAEGLITVRRKVGITIFYPDVKFVGNSFQFRGLLEREGLRKFARSVTPDWIARMRERARRDHRLRARDATTSRALPRPGEAAGATIPRQLHRGLSRTTRSASTTRRLTQKMYLIRLHNLECRRPGQYGDLDAGAPGDRRCAGDAATSRPPARRWTAPQGRAAPGADDLDGVVDGSRCAAPEVGLVVMQDDEDRGDQPREQSGEQADHHAVLDRHQLADAAGREPGSDRGDEAADPDRQRGIRSRSLRKNCGSDRPR